MSATIWSWAAVTLLLSMSMLGCASEVGEAPLYVNATNQVGPTERPARLYVPPAHDGATPLPLVVLLHGLGASAGLQDLLFGFTHQARERGFYLLLPEGTLDSQGRQFWNATELCCDFDGSGVDDEAYLMALLDEVEHTVPIDRVFMTGHSNGAFMSYRLACNHGERFAGVVAVAGLGEAEEVDCPSPAPQSLLHIHGDADDLVPYDPYAAQMLRRWERRAGCAEASTMTMDPLDLDADIPGAETTRQRYGMGCDAGVDLELWTIEGGGHIPSLTRSFGDEVADWMLSAP